MLFPKSNSKEKKENTALMIVILILSIPCFALSLVHNGFLSLLPFVRDDFLLTRSQIGYYSTFIFISASLLAIFTGDIVDKFGPKKSVIAGIISMSFLWLLYGFSVNYNMLLFLALIAGIGFSIITPSVNKGVMLAVSPGKRAISMGITQMGFGLGGILGTSFLPLLARIYGWRFAVQIAAIFAMITGVLVFKYYQEVDIQQKTIIESDKKDTQKSFKENLCFIIKNKKLLKICIVGTIFGISVGAVLPHFSVFLTEDLRLAVTSAGLAFAIMQLGGIISRPFWGWVSDKIFKGNRNISLFVIGISIGIVYLLFAFFISLMQGNLFITFLFSFLLGCTSSGWAGVHFVSVVEFAGDKLAGIATGLSLVFLRIGMLAAPPIFGFIADINGNYQFCWLTFGIFITIVSFLFLQKD
ncbi:MAG: MFS transporter [Atribacterota bacterium]|nr:MFS transporter [Atribacterota bacterium]